MLKTNYNNCALISLFLLIPGFGLIQNSDIQLLNSIHNITSFSKQTPYTFTKNVKILEWTIPARTIQTEEVITPGYTLGQHISTGITTANRSGKSLCQTNILCPDITNIIPEPNTSLYTSEGSAQSKFAFYHSLVQYSSNSSQHNRKFALLVSENMPGTGPLHMSEMWYIFS
jgi:hypothetical protein